jgi:isoleucyl-tRNA synthetase
VTPELAAEGLAREIVHRVQGMRRDAGFDLADRLELSYESDDEVAAVLERWDDYVRQETLAERVARGGASEGAHTDTQKVDGHELTLAVRRA